MKRTTLLISLAGLMACGQTPEPSQSETKEIHRITNEYRVRWDLEHPQYFNEIVEEYYRRGTKMFSGFGVKEAFCESGDVAKQRESRDRTITAIFNAIASLPPSYRDRLYELHRDTNWRVIRRSPDKEASGGLAVTRVNENKKRVPDYVIIKGTPSMIEHGLLHEFGHVFHYDWNSRDRRVLGLALDDLVKKAADPLRHHQLGSRYLEEWAPESASYYLEFLAESFSSFYASPAEHEAFKRPAGADTSRNDAMTRAYRYMSHIFGDQPVWKRYPVKNQFRMYDPNRPKDYRRFASLVRDRLYAHKDGPWCEVKVDFGCNVNKFGMVETVTMVGTRSDQCKAFTRTFTCTDSWRCWRAGETPGGENTEYIDVFQDRLDYSLVRKTTYTNNQVSYKRENLTMVPTEWVPEENKFENPPPEPKPEPKKPEDDKPKAEEKKPAAEEKKPAADVKKPEADVKSPEPKPEEKPEPKPEEKPEPKPEEKPAKKPEPKKPAAEEPKAKPKGTTDDLGTLPPIIPLDPQDPPSTTSRDQNSQDEEN